jgi:DNA helicase-2/ATP-dependent DNA helicase PcrA
MHNTIRELRKLMQQDRPLSMEDVESIFLREWRSAGFEDEYHEAEYKKEGLEQLRAFVATAAQEKVNLYGQEKAFRVPFENNVEVTGRADEVLQVAPGQVEIVDYKTGRPKSESDARKSIQLSLYALGARDDWEVKPARLTFYNLTSNQPVSSTRDDKQLQKARDLVQEVAAEIRGGRFAAQPGFVCNFCDCAPICPAHEQPATIRR